jgi:hypothetical protein
MSDEERKLILLSDFVEQRSRKEHELEFYQKELEKLQMKMSFIQRDIDLTNTIIKIIEQEKVFDIKEQLMENTKLIKPNEE